MHNILVMIQFMRRDIKMYAHRLPRYLINDALIRPILYTFVFAYIFPRVTVQVANPAVTYVGSMLYLITPLLFGLNIDYLLDIEREKSILYKLTILPIQYILLGRVLVTAVISTIAVLGAFPLAYMIVGSDFNMSNAQCIPFLLVCVSASVCIAAIVLCFMSGMKGTDQSNWFWRRFVYPLVMFGGFLAPWYVMFQASTLFGYAMLFNPLLYVTEGMRSALFGGPYIPWYYCVAVLLVCGTFALGLAGKLLRRNIDYV